MIIKRRPQIASKKSAAPAKPIVVEEPVEVVEEEIEVLDEELKEVSWEEIKSLLED